MVDGAVTWAKSQVNTIKVMADAAIFEESLAFGTVAKDSDGELEQA